MTREQKFEEALKLIADTFDKNHGRQDEKLLDIPKIARAALSAPKAEAEPVAYLVHNFMVARQPVSAIARFPEPDHYLYPANRKDDAEATAKMLRADCDPLYTSPVPALTDEAVERAAKAIHDGPLGASDEEDFGDNKASDWCREVARAALLAAFPGKGEGE